MHLQFSIKTNILPSLREIESKLCPKSKAKEIFNIKTYLYTFWILVLGVLKRGHFPVPLPRSFLRKSDRA